MEKRLAEVWAKLAASHPNLHLVLSRDTYKGILRCPELKEIWILSDRILFFEKRPTGSFSILWNLFRFSLRVERDAVVHYFNYAPPFVDWIMGRRMIVSWVSNSFPSFSSTPRNFFNWINSVIALYFADSIDILTPSVVPQLPRWLSKRRIAVTPGGSFVDFEFYKPKYPKVNDVVFLGVTGSEKNAVAFAKAIPLVLDRMSIEGCEVRFLIYGDPGDHEDEVNDLVSEYQKLGIRVYRGQTYQPVTILESAKSFVSLQVSSNYPSKSLLEAMSCGCVPIINLSGESHRMACKEGAIFIPASFTVQQLADSVSKVLLLDGYEFSRRSTAVREHVINNFNVITQLKYYENLWFADK